MKRKSLFFIDKNKVAIREEELTGPTNNQVMIRSIVSAISAGTEMLFYRGQVSLDQSMDLTIKSLSGKLAYPFKYGYSVIGEIMETGPEVASDWKGKIVFCYHPHETHFNIGIDQVIPVPLHLKPEEGAFLAFMETALTFVLDGHPLMGEQAVIYGQGVIGLLTTALLAQIPLANLITLEPSLLRREKSLQLGARISLDPLEGQTLSQLKLQLREGSFYSGADLTYEISGNPAALDSAISVTGFDGRIVIGSWYGSQQVNLNLTSNFHRSRMQLISSQVSTINPKWSGHWNKTRCLQTALGMIEQIKPAQLITHRFHFSNAAQAYELIDKFSENTLQVVFTYE